MKKTKFFIRAAAVAASCVLMFASCSGGSSGGGDDYSENQPGTGGGTEAPGGSGSGTPGVPGGTEPGNPDNPTPGGPDVPSVSYESASAVLKAVLGESAYSSYAETSSSVTLTQTALMEAADIFPAVQGVIPDASSFSAAQSKVNGASSESQKVLVSMAEGKISITKGAAEDVQYMWYYFVMSPTPENAGVNYGVYKGSGSVAGPVYTISSADTAVLFSGRFDLSRMQIKLDQFTADWDSAELFFAETENAADADDSIKNGIKAAIEEINIDVEYTDQLLASIQRQKAVYTSKLNTVIFTDMAISDNSSHPMLNLSLYVENTFDVFPFYMWSDGAEKIKFRGNAGDKVLDGSENPNL